MKKFLLAIAAVLACAAPVAAADFSIAVGQEGRGYEAFGKEMKARLDKQHNVEVVNYEGSDDISRAVCDGVNEVGIVQIDAIYTRAKEGCSLRVIGTYGTEYAFLLSPPNSKVGSLHDLDSSSKVLIDTIGSGTDLFWHTIVSIENGEHGNKSSWSDATPVNDFNFLASTMAETGEIDAVLFVNTPSSTEIKELFDAGWELAKFKDKDIDDEEFNGTSLYPREDAEIAGTGGWLSGNESNASYAVRSFVVVNSAAVSDRRLFADLARTVKTLSPK